MNTEQTQPTPAGEPTTRELLSLLAAELTAEEKEKQDEAKREAFRQMFVMNKAAIVWCAESIVNAARLEASNESAFVEYYAERMADILGSDPARGYWRADDVGLFFTGAPEPIQDAEQPRLITQREWNAQTVSELMRRLERVPGYMKHDMLRLAQLHDRLTELASELGTLLQAR